MTKFINFVLFMALGITLGYLFAVSLTGV